MSAEAPLEMIPGAAIGEASAAPVTDVPARSAFHDSLARLSPGYFAFVMATSIVSIGLRSVGAEAASQVLLWIAVTGYAVLWVLYLWRAFAHRDAMMSDLRSPQIAFAYFTVVAGTDVLAVRLIQDGRVAVAVAMVAFATILWFVFGYLLPWQVLMTRDGKPILARTNGTWFIWAVASQSLAVGMAQIQPHLGAEARWIGILAVLSWSVGVVLYAGIALLVLLRIIHYGITPEQFDPPYWVAMGALAIAVVAGANIVDMDSTPMVDASRTIIGGTVVIFWCFSAWLIPMLLGAGVWRHGIRRVPLRYVPTLWSMVFPMGMFAVASILIGRIDRMPIVETVGTVSLFVALGVWALVFLAMMRRALLVLWRTARAPSGLSRG